MWRRLEGGGGGLLKPHHLEPVRGGEEGGVNTWVMSFLSSYAILAHARRVGGSSQRRFKGRTETDGDREKGGRRVQLDESLWGCRAGLDIHRSVSSLTTPGDVMLCINNVLKSVWGITFKLREISVMFRLLPGGGGGLRLCYLYSESWAVCSRCAVCAEWDQEICTGQCISAQVMNKNRFTYPPKSICLFSAIIFRLNCCFALL